MLHPLLNLLMSLLMNLLMNDIRSFKDFPIKACRECCFSHGGQYFAAVNGTAIFVYQTYTCEPITSLRGHNGKVRSLAWSADDRYLVSCGADGAIFRWDMRNRSEKNQAVVGECSLSCIAGGDDGIHVYVVGEGVDRAAPPFHLECDRVAALAHDLEDFAQAPRFAFRRPASREPAHDLRLVGPGHPHRCQGRDQRNPLADPDHHPGAGLGPGACDAERVAARTHES